VGNKGAGKSAVARAVARRFRCSPQSLSYCEVVQCKLLKGSKRSVVQGAFESAVRRAIANAPSVIILDDLDALLPAAGSSGGGDSAEDVQVWRVYWGGGVGVGPIGNPVIHTYIHPYIHTYIHTHIYTYIHTYMSILPTSRCDDRTKVHQLAFRLGMWNVQQRCNVCTSNNE
jgi:SpoVK/Ycf46/Vps4 family AAA+-type ATPase